MAVDLRIPTFKEAHDAEFQKAKFATNAQLNHRTARSLGRLSGDLTVLDPELTDLERIGLMGYRRQLSRDFDLTTGSDLHGQEEYDILNALFNDARDTQIISELTNRRGEDV
ncbi:MAG: hypothetical protein U0520_04220 [Candidatus Saccharimonadales bacterium]